MTAGLSRRELFGHVALQNMKVRTREIESAGMIRCFVPDLTIIQRCRLAIGSWAGMNPPKPERWWEMYRAGLFGK